MSMRTMLSRTLSRLLCPALISALAACGGARANDLDWNDTGGARNAGGGGAAPTVRVGGAGATASAGAGGSLAGNGDAVAGAAGMTSIPPHGKLDPPDGTTLLVIGQDTASIEEYAAQVGPMPAGVMLYTNIKDLAGLAFATDFGAGQNDLQHWAASAAPVAIQVGLNLVDSLDNVGQGGMDDRLDTMGDLLRDAGRAVFLRIGYEFDSAWAGYEPNQFKLAFQRIVTRLRAKHADNVAFVFHSWGFQHSFGQASVGAWYPGDEYVDWVGVSLFPGWDAASTQAAEGARSEIANFARQHDKPFMIAESGPRQAFQPSRGADAWNGWYQGIFDFIAAHDVKMFSYINANWDAQPLWAGQGWGDTRVQTNPYVLEKWRAQLAQPRFAVTR